MLVLLFFEAPSVAVGPGSVFASVAVAIIKSEPHQTNPEGFAGGQQFAMSHVVVVVSILRAQGGQQTLHFRLTASSGSTVSVALVPEGSLQTIAEQSYCSGTPKMLGILDSTRKNEKEGGGGARKSSVA